MSIVKAKTNAYGPGTLDIQIEQGADFYLPLSLTKGGVPWVITSATFDAHFSLAWAPGASLLTLTVSIVSGPGGTLKVKFPAASSLGIALPSPPRKGVSPEVFQLGNWVLNITDTSIVDEPTRRLINGIVYLDRDPCLT